MKRLPSAGKSFPTERRISKALFFQSLFLLVVGSPVESQEHDTTRIGIPLLFFSDTVHVTAFREPEQFRLRHQGLTKIPQTDIWHSVSPAVDDLLRATPGFSLFRRTSSRVANPTTQGVSLRGIGPSGASRSFVLIDHIPLNDPFGGWVYWNRINRAALGSIEVVRGGTSSLYGGEALSGVIQLHTDRKPHGRLLLHGTSLGGYEGSASWSDLFALSPHASLKALVNVKGGLAGNYYVISSDQRGKIDTKAQAEYRHANVSFQGIFPSFVASVGGERFLEDRNNGTERQTNSTRTTLTWATWLWQTSLRSSLEGTFQLHRQDYDQSFTSISSDRNAETLIRRQTVPSDSWLGQLIGRSQMGTHLVQVGLELGRKTGRSDELQFESGRPTSLLMVGGIQRSVGLYAQDRLSVLKNLTMALSARIDWLTNSQTDSSLTQLSSAKNSLGILSESGSQFLSWRLSFGWDVQPFHSLRASMYRAHRFPTLNELYRGFRVGSVQTFPNPNLRSEFIEGIEIGYDMHASQDLPLSVAATLFSQVLRDAISNVTLSSEGGTLARRRENIGLLLSRGAEIEAEWWVRPGLRLKGNYTIIDSKVNEAVDGSLVGQKVPQVPGHQVYLEGGWLSQLLDIRIAFKYSSSQFEDDQNSLVLFGYHLVDLAISYTVSPQVTISFSLENATDEVVEISRTPLLGIGSPRVLALGLIASL